MSKGKRRLHRPGYFFNQLASVRHRYEPDKRTLLVAPEWVDAFIEAYGYANMYWKLLGGPRQTRVCIDVSSSDFPGKILQAWGAGEGPYYFSHLLRLPLRVASKLAHCGGTLRLDEGGYQLVFPARQKLVFGALWFECRRESKQFRNSAFRDRRLGN